MSFDRINSEETIKNEGLNPFGTGQCLSTMKPLNIGD